MTKDQLYLLPIDFEDQGKTYYCPGCVELLGVLESYPQLKEKVEIHYVDFPRPRPKLVEKIGEENQGAPVLILAKKPSNLPTHLKIEEANGFSFVADAREIGEYWAHAYGIGLPH
ncbi:MAG TPA: DUF3088 family protein [Opitutales bacterium]|nr:DUF3088 family protein [Opitutales bacterium]